MDNIILELKGWREDWMLLVWGMFSAYAEGVGIGAVGCWMGWL